ncbi:CopD family protein [Chitinolyticbacter meiyuanensis]|uniref:CopD family protein n=1 Tax=Chitinolyticbacter meiyuanensis TaxID=682798 RepID=UPI0011E5AB7D|nr:CopD family protein [Chitinolyticbacter meiyuanensis]
MYGLLLLLHVLGATIWTGGHIVLSVVILPRALREKSPAQLLQFESVYEKIGLPALVAQIITGIALAHQMLGSTDQWFDFTNPVYHVVAVKLFLLSLTVALAIDARLRVIPHLTEHNMKSLAWHILPVTAISILFVAAGVSFRTGWLY